MSMLTFLLIFHFYRWLHLMEPYPVFVSLFYDQDRTIGQPRIFMYQKTTKVRDIKEDIKTYLASLGSVEYDEKTIPIILDQIKMELFQINLDNEPRHQEPIDRKDIGNYNFDFVWLNWLILNRRGIPWPWLDWLHSGLRNQCEHSVCRRLFVGGGPGDAGEFTYD